MPEGSCGVDDVSGQYTFTKGDCMTVYECVKSHGNGVSIAEISNETGIPCNRTKGCVMKLSNNGKVKMVDPSERMRRWKAI